MKRKFGISLFIISALLVLSNCNQINNKKNVNNNINEIDKQNYLDKGMDIALEAQSVLGGNLSSAIQKSGTSGALKFCNEKAIPLTDSIALALNATIKRVSDKNRNIDNGPNKTELEYIRQAKMNIEKNETVEPKLQEINNEMVGYYPIMTNSMCLKCHGNPQKDIDANTYNIINERYPKDKATGYLANELRGIWVINMDK